MDCCLGTCKFFTHNNKGLPHPKDKALDLWNTYNFYWKEESVLKTKQKIVTSIIAEIISTLREYNIEDFGYWHEVSLYIYHIEDVINNKKPCFEK